jgi:hypothetical protein
VKYTIEIGDAALAELQLHAENAGVSIEQVAAAWLDLDGRHYRRQRELLVGRRQLVSDEEARRGRGARLGP